MLTEQQAARAARRMSAARPSDRHRADKKLGARGGAATPPPCQYLAELPPTAAPRSQCATRQRRASRRLPRRHRLRDDRLGHPARTTIPTPTTAAAAYAALAAQKNSIRSTSKCVYASPERTAARPPAAGQARHGQELPPLQTRRGSAARCDRDEIASTSGRVHSDLRAAPGRNCHRSRNNRMT